MTATHTGYPPRVPDVGGDARLSVLVIDDCPDTTGTTVELLRLAGHDAAAAASGRDGLAAADGNTPDVVLIDLGLPDLDGCEVAREFRRRAGRRRPLLVAVTGFGAEADRRRTAAAGFDLHLVKPVPPADLFRLLERFARVLGR